VFKLKFDAEDVGDAIQAGENLLAAFDAPVLATTSLFKDSAAVADDVSDFIGQLHSGQLIRLGFSPTLDSAVKLTPGSLVAILGAGGCGKSTLAEHILLEALNTEGDVNVAMISAEMAAYEVGLKLISTIDGKGYHDYDELKKMTPEEVLALNKKIKASIRKFNVIDDFGGIGLEQIENALLEQISLGQPASLVVVDHMLALSQNLENTTLEETAKALKAIAIKCKCCVVVICHTRKSPNQKNSRTIYRPTLQDEYGSGGLQKYANVILGVAIDQPNRTLLVETLKKNRMGGKYVDVQLVLDNWQLKEPEFAETEATKYNDPNIDYEEVY
jgi:ABC-type uncharacterized transport system YnjBCD ATPase subunit